MAQRDDKTMAKKERPSSVKLRTSFSVPSPPVESKTTSRRYSTLKEPLYYPQSPAELYVLARSQMVFQAAEQKDLSPESPLSIPTSMILPCQWNLTHAERMNNWHEQKLYELSKKQKYRYIYGKPPKSPIGLSFTFPPSSARKNDTQSSKKDT